VSLRSLTLAEQGPRLDVFENFPCWESGSVLLKQQITTLRLKNVADIGGGANPLLDHAFIEESGVDYSLLDISKAELDRAPAYYKKIQVDVAAPEGYFLRRVGEEQFDLVFSHMFLEHVPNPLRVHRNIYASLKPGGLAIHFFASSNNLPLTMNRLLPGWVTDILTRVAQPNRDLIGYEKKFPAYYAMCGAPSKALNSKYREIGFDVLRHTGFIGHDYYKRVPILREIERGLRPILLATGIPLISDSLLILRKRSTFSSQRAL
jgi:SAM-dependent methyltransferase